MQLKAKAIRLCLVEFKQVAEEHTKIKQVKHQLKALGRDSEHAGQTADALE